MPSDGSPYVYNGVQYRGRLPGTATQHLQAEGTQALAGCYVADTASGHWLWRNRMGVENIRITMSSKSDNITVDNAKALPLNRFDRPSENVVKVVGWIRQSLGSEAFTLLSVETRIQAGYEQEVHPSRELILDAGESNKNKVFYQTSGKTEAHSQKIGSAIRIIDARYAQGTVFPTAAEPYGAITTLDTTFRQPRQKNDFHTLFDNWTLEGEQPSAEQ